MRFSKFTDFSAPKEITDLKSIIDLVKSDQLKDHIGQLRSALEAKDHKSSDRLKKSLPSFTPSGIFKEHRKEENLEEYSKVVHLDIDKISEHNIYRVKEILEKEKSCLAFFVSPSGNGLKVFVKVGFGVEKHSVQYPKILAHFESLLGVKIDPQCKDIPRLCFLSHDPDAYVNADASDFNSRQLQSFRKGKNLGEVLREVEQRSEFKDGNRNNFVFAFAVACCHYGIRKYECLNYCMEEFSEIEEEIPSTLSSAYSGRYDYKGKMSSGIRVGKTSVIEEKLIDLGYSFRYNVVRQVVEVSNNGSTYSPLTDNSFNDIYRDLDGSGHQISSERLKIVLNSSFSIPYDPFTSFVLQLPDWDGVDRITMLAETVPVQNELDWENSLKKWLIAVLVCALKEDSVNQQVLVLGGEQGIGKTTWINNLIPVELKDYVVNGVVNPKDKDSLIQLSECLLINMDELESLSPGQQGFLKELITKPLVRTRRPYARNAERAPRRASFAAAVNNISFLTDTTGNRRFLCFQVDGSINFRHEIDLYQLWAQVDHLRRMGVKYWFDGREIERINALNEQFYQASSEEELLLEFYEPSLVESNETVYLSSSMVIQSICDKIDRTVILKPVNMGKALSRNQFKTVKKDGVKKYLLRIKDSR